MSILQYKYKAHRLVNTLFYIIVFAIGFILGFGAKEIDFSKLVSQVLMVDNVQAYTLATYENIEINEDEIYDKFLEIIPDFNILEYKNIYCDFEYSAYKLHCRAYNDISLEKFSFKDSYSNSIIFNFLSNSNTFVYMFNYNYSSKKFTSYDASSNPSYHHIFIASDTSSYSSASTFSLNYNIFNRINKLDFSGTNLKFNENLFKDNPDFKEVCVPENSSFAITPIQGNYSDTGQYEDFIWFPYGLNNGLSKVQYDSSSEYTEGNIIPYPEETMREHFYFSNKEEINKFYDKDLPSDFENAGYTDKYSYYGYDAYKIFIVYKNGLFRYPIFTFDNPSKLTISSSGTTHGGGGLRLDVDEEIEISTDYCFYIKNGYNVSLVNLNEWGDFNGTVSSPDGDYNFNTSHNEFKSNTESFLTQPIKFINSMKDTINFINSLIYEFYISLPVLLRAFIITVFIILIIMLIMKIGGYN